VTDERTVAGNPAPASADDERPTRPPRLSFRSRLTLALLFAAIVPLAVFGVVVLAFESPFAYAGQMIVIADIGEPEWHLA